MKIPNGFFGQGPGPDDPNTRDHDAYLRNKMQMTVATSTFAGVALVGMFCSCIWFACCRNSSSKTRKKPRTWANANPDGGHPNPYAYDGYLDGQGYTQMNNEGAAAPYSNAPVYDENGLANAYDFNDHFGFNQHGGKGQMTTLFGESAATFPAHVATGNLEGGGVKDVPPSYTALFFAASDPATGIKGNAGGTGEVQTQSTDPRVTNIQPIHLKVTSSADINKRQRPTEAEAPKIEKPTESRKHHHPYGMEDDDMDDDFIHMKSEREDGPVSLMSVESAPDKDSNDEKQGDTSGDAKPIPEEKRGNPPPYNPSYNFSSSGGYKKF